MLALLPLAVTTYVTVTPIARGVHSFTAGRDHLSHRLQDRGYTVPGSMLLLQIVSVCGAVAAIAVAILVS